MEAERVISREDLMKSPFRLPLPEEWYMTPLESRPLNKTSQNDYYYVKITWEIMFDDVLYVARPFHEDPRFNKHQYGCFLLDEKLLQGVFKFLKLHGVKV
jgi:hypothetical protein